jgi:predicted CoA-binding protein
MSTHNGYTLVVGASENPDRYSNMAIRRLVEHNVPVYALGLKPGNVAGVELVTGFPELKGIDTITLYVGPQRLAPMHDYLLRLKPRRVIFNPGTEDAEFASKLKSSGVEVTEACTLVLLSTGQY